MKPDVGRSLRPECTPPLPDVPLRQMIDRSRDQAVR
jgi:hypothetical protein